MKVVPTFAFTEGVTAPVFEVVGATMLVKVILIQPLDAAEVEFAVTLKPDELVRFPPRDPA